MQKQYLRVAARLAVLCLLLSAYSIVVVRAWDDGDYFAALLACDDNYFGTLDTCRSNPSYPNNPDEPQCRFNSGNSYADCISNIPWPTYEPDFCAMARAARDNCVAQYGPDSGNHDIGAYMDCRSASGVDQCE